MPFWIELAVLLLSGIEVRTRGREGWLAFADAMHVESVLARRQAFKRKIEPDARTRLRELDGADVFAVRGLDLGRRGQRRCRRGLSRVAGSQPLVRGNGVLSAVRSSRGHWRRG